MNITYELGKITDWLAAFGTVGAVAWALYLSRIESREQLQIISLLSQDEITIWLFNSGRRLIVVDDATLRIGRFFSVEENSFSSLLIGSRELPKTVHPTDVHLLHLSLSPYAGYTPDLIFKQ